MLRRDRLKLCHQPFGGQAIGVSRRVSAAEAGGRALFLRRLLRPAPAGRRQGRPCVLYGECLGGALYWNDFLPIAKEAGFLDPRLVTSKPIGITNEAVKQKLGAAKFFSATYRLFKLDSSRRLARITVRR